MSLYVLALLSIVIHADAQVHAFDNEPWPESKTLKSVNAFYVYDHQDAPDTSAGTPSVRFHTSARFTDYEKYKDYKGLQLSIMPFRDFWKRIKRDGFCGPQQSPNAHESMSDTLLVQKPELVSPEDVFVYVATVPIQNPADPVPPETTLTIRSTGVYILSISNCGDLNGGTISGTVIVKNAYGFLPGKDYYKMPFYGWLSLAYIGLTACWLIATLRHRNDVFALQHCIGAILLLGLLEAILSWVFYKNWNAAGHRGRYLFTLSVIASVSKSMLSYMLVLVASHGWGVTRPYLDPETTKTIKMLSFSYIVLGILREFVMQFSSQFSFSTSFVLLCLVPGSAINGFIFYWIIRSLTRLIETLKERRQFDKLMQFECLWKLIVVTTIVGAVVLLVQAFQASQSISVRWKVEWFWNDGLPHMIFLFVLGAMMFLWYPGPVSKMYVYAGDGEDDKTDKGENPWVDEGVDDGDDDTFWKETHHKQSKTEGSELAKVDTEIVHAQTIGAPVTQEVTLPEKF